MAYHQYQYGSLTLPYSRLDTQSAPIYADDGITQSGTQYTFTISGTVAKPTQSEFAALVTTMRCQLQTPRLTLTIMWSVDNLTWTPLYQYGYGSDIDFGPKPTNLNIQEFTGGLAATYSFSVKVTSKDCFGGMCQLANNPPSGILSLSRNFSFSVNENGLTTMTTSGILTVGSNTSVVTPANQYRGWVTPLLPNNFKRVQESYNQSSNGLQLQYSVTDQEVMWTYPPPITSGRANFSIHVSGVGGLLTYSLTGQFGTTSNHAKTDLYQAIVNLAVNRFPDGAFSAGDGQTAGPAVFIWVNRTITEEVYENTLSFNLVGTASGYSVVGSINNIGDTTWLQGMGGTPPGSNGKNNAIGAFGWDAPASPPGSNVGTPAVVPFDACAGSPQIGSVSVNPSPGSFPTLTFPSGPSPTPTPYSSNSGTSDGTGTYGELSPQAKTVLFISVYEQLSFEINNYIRRFPSKTIGSPPICQQAALPTVTLIQAGYVTVDDPTGKNPPTAPPPFYAGLSDTGGPMGNGNNQSNAQTAYLESSSISPAVSQPLAVAGQVRWTLGYRYTLLLNNIITSTKDLGIAFPNDPRLSATPPLVPDLPELIINPGS